MLADLLVPPGFRHVPPICDDTCPCIALVARVLGIRTIRTVARSHHQTHRATAFMQLTFVYCKLPPELKQRHISNLVLPLL